MPTHHVSCSPLQDVQEQIPQLCQVAAVLDVLKGGINDPVDYIHLAAWRDITEQSLQIEVERLYRSIDTLLQIVADAMKEGTL